jgi:hypothetical protein
VQDLANWEDGLAAECYEQQANLEQWWQMHGSFIPVQEPLLLHQQGPLPQQMLPEGDQDLGDVVGVDGNAPGHNVGVYQALTVQKKQSTSA